MTDTPKPEDVHYTGKVETAATIKEAAKYWVRQADTVLRYELAEQINAGEFSTASEWWRSETHKRAIELINTDEQLRPGYKADLWKTIEDEALYHHAGFESSEEWFTSSGKGGGAGHDEQWWGSFLIPWCKANGVFKDDAAADLFFLTPVNVDSTGKKKSRYGPLHDATSTLRDIIERDVYSISIEEQADLVRGILLTVADPTKKRSEQKAAFNVTKSKMLLTVHKMGDDEWILQGILTERHLERLKKDLFFSANIDITTPEALGLERESGLDWVKES